MALRMASRSDKRPTTVFWFWSVWVGSTDAKSVFPGALKLAFWSVQSSCVQLLLFCCCVCSVPLRQHCTSAMLLSRSLIALAVSVPILICYANNVLPRGRFAAVDIPAVAGILELTVNISNRPDAVPQPRLRLPAIPLQEHLNSFDPSPAQVRTTLLGARHSCDEGYGYCYGEPRLSFAASLQD